MDHLSRFSAELERFHAAIGRLDATVPSCPAWRVGDLVRHVGSVHRTFHRVAREGWMQRPPAAEVDDRPPADDPAVVAWAREQGRLLLDALTGLDPAAPRWNFSHGPQVAAFIPRRMHHETTIHRWDLEDAYGTPGPTDPRAAADGIEEYLDVFVPRRGIWTGRTAIVHVAVDGDRTFELVLPEGELPHLRDDVAAEPDATVGGPPERLLLALWGRTPLDELHRSGDRSLVADLRAHAYT